MLPMYCIGGGKLRPAAAAALLLSIVLEGPSGLR